MRTLAINSASLPMTGHAVAVARQILSEVMAYRRTPKTENFICDNADCSACSSIHLPRILSAVQMNEPVRFVLPAFPGKSPNPEKVLGVLPDQAELLSLQFLGNLCQRIKSFYSPGIEIVICSDGRVFSDVVGIKEDDISAYQIELDRMIKELSLSDVSTFNLDDIFYGLDFYQMRSELMKAYAKTMEELKDSVRSDEEAKRMYCGISRFLFEDSLHAGQTKSRAAIQKDARSRAYEVIRRSNAWSELIAERFPEAVRLSIHPQSCGSKKLGIRLIGNESWMTPWHGVAVATKEGHVLLKRSEAQALGAELVYSPAGRPSHYKLSGVL